MAAPARGGKVDVHRLQGSFAKLRDLLATVARGEYGEPRSRSSSFPATSTMPTSGSWDFDNQVSTLTLDGDEATLRLERTAPGEIDAQALLPSYEPRLA